MATVEKTAVTHQEQEQEEQLAFIANQDEHETTKLQAIRQLPKTFGWCLFAVWIVLLVSFENQASGNVLGIPEFRKDFGSFYDGGYVLPANWQSAFSGAPIASQVFGSLFGGQVSDFIGRKFTVLIALVFSIVAITLEMVSTTNPMFFGAKFLNGFAVGTIQAVASAYIGEIAPLALRGLMTCLIALSYTVGPFVVALIVNTTGNYTDRWAYRAVFCSQYGFAGIALIFVWFMPESPWWLVRKHRDDKALRSLQRLSYKAETGDDEKRLATIKLTLEAIRKETEGASYIECFRKSNLRRTLLSFSVLVIQQFTGIVFAASYSTYYAQLAGYSISESFKLQICQQVLSMFGNVISWYLIDKAGRRTLSIWGTFGLTILMWIMGGLAVAGSRNYLKGAVAMILVYCWLYNVTIGATAFTCLTETAAPRLRVKTVSVGLTVSYSIQLMWSFVLPYLFNPNEANLGGKLGFVFGGLSIPCLLLLYFFQPETKGRSYRELDEMFMKRVRARDFATYKTETEAQGENAMRRLSQG